MKIILLITVLFSFSTIAKEVHVCSALCNQAYISVKTAISNTKEDALKKLNVKCRSVRINNIIKVQGYKYSMKGNLGVLPLQNIDCDKMTL